MKRPRSFSFPIFSRLSFSQKFTVITLVFLIPVIAFAPLISDQLTNIDKYGVSELSGTIYLRSLWNVSENVREYVTTARKYSDQKIQLAELLSVQSKVDASINDFDKVHNQHSSSLHLANNSDVIQKQWSAIKASIQSANQESFESNQSALFDSIATFTAQVGDSSYLILDPSLDTYYMMDTVLIKLPENQRLTFQAYQLAEQSIQRGSFSAEDKTLLISLIGRLEANIAAMNRNIGTAIQNDQTGTMKKIISSPLDDYQQKLLTFTKLLGNTLNNPTGVEPASVDDVLKEIEAAYKGVHASDSRLYDAASASLELGIQYRIDALRQRLYWMSIIASISILIAFLIGRSMMRSISTPLADLISATKLLSTGNMSSRVSVEDPGEIGQVGIAFNQMAEELERDKTALVARSAELAAARNQSEKRARDLQIISEISRIISSEQRLDVLLPLIAKVVSDKLKFYHVGFFLLDASREFAILEATNSEGGQEMLVQDYRLKIGGAGIVSAAASTGKPQIALDVENSRIFQQNPFLPNTRSEVALPIRLSGDIIGVLDIQSLQENAFGLDDLEVFEVLASQVGVAIQNARLYEQNVQSLKDIEDAYRRLSDNTWSKLLQQVDTKAYVYDGVSSRPLTEIQDSQKPTTLSIPVTIRGKVIGNLRLNPLDPNRTWTEDETVIANATAERAALALESARLLEDAQKRASRESFLSDMASKLSTSFQLDSILRDTVEELGQTLSGSTVSFQLINPSAPPIEKSNGQSRKVE